MSDAIELRHLRYLVALAEELHFGRAARRLSIPQPTLSREIKTLERRLGVEVFRRSKRHVELTDEGLVLLEQARRTVDQVERMVLTAQRASRGELGVLQLGFSPPASFNIVPAAIRAFRRLCPEVELALHEMQAVELLEALNQGDVKVGFFHARPHDETTIASEVVFKEKLIMAMPRGHHLATQRTLRQSHVRREPTVLIPGQPGGLREQIARRYGLVSDQSFIRQRDLSVHTVISLVAAGLGVALVPASIQKTRRVGVIYRPILEAALDLDILMAWRGDDKSPVVARFLDASRTAAKALARSQ
jgi:DNA-binding transcriptional LysR family regulator